MDVLMRDVAVEDVKWLWYPYMPIGKLTMIQGDPGEGKTTFVLEKREQTILECREQIANYRDMDAAVKKKKAEIRHGIELLAEIIAGGGISDTHLRMLVDLCLEDSFSRIQDRLFDFTSEAPSNLHFTTMANALGDGLETQIENFVRQHEDTRLIVIDTLQYIRSVSKDSNAYANDYRDIR